MSRRGRHDAGEDFIALSGKFPVGPVRAGIQQQNGFTTISEEAFLRSFANGVVHPKAKVLFAVQEPAATSLFGERTTAAAWHFKPSWCAVSNLDRTINPDLEAISDKTHERDHRRTGGRSPVSDLSSQTNRRLDPGCCGSARVAER
jgi:hypothetical protein